VSPVEPSHARLQTLLSWSGGKDAAWTLQVLRQRNDIEVVGLLTTLTEEYDRVAMQGIRHDVLLAQAEATGLPLIEAWIPRAADNASYESSLAAAFSQARKRWPGLHHIAFGDLLLAEVRAWREALCARLGWEALFPLFGSDTAALAREMLNGGLRAALCCVDTTQLDGRFAGREFGETLLRELPKAVDPCGENGEFHTCVHDGPMFAHPLQLQRGDDVLRDDRFLYTDYL